MKSPTALLAMILAGSVHAQSSLAKFSQTDCSLIDGFEESVGQEFSSFFSDMVHQHEFCFDVGRDCEMPLMKRTKPTRLFLKQREAFQNEQVAAAAERAVLRTWRTISENSGIRFTLDSEGETDSYIWTVFVNPEFVAHDPATYEAAYIARSEFSLLDSVLEDRRHLFREFVSSDTPCVTVYSFHDDNIIRDAHIWIKTDVGPAVMERCVAEEWYNSMGLSEGTDVPSLFDYEFGRDPASNGLSGFDTLLLRSLYAQELPPGMTRAETTGVMNSLLQEGCGK